MALFLSTDGDPAPILGTAQREIGRMDPQVPLNNPYSMREVIDQSLWPAKLGAMLLGILGGMALCLAAVGLYGLMSYSVGQRRLEIGLRMALGAEQGTVLQLILRQGMLLVAIGLALGLSAAYAVSRVVSTLLYGVSATDPVTFGGVTAVLIVVALVASIVPAMRASRVDPVAALRTQ
jgi:ABC-type antimicrobial peptide transport system permease subunit